MGCPITHRRWKCRPSREKAWGGGLSKECLKFVQDVLRVGYIVIEGMSREGDVSYAYFFDKCPSRLRSLQPKLMPNRNIFCRL